jgi:hypothetical protein
MKLHRNEQCLLRHICAAIDRFVEGISNAPNVSSEGFTSLIVQHVDGD